MSELAAAAEEEATRLDESMPLHRYRDRFVIPGATYFKSHALGPLHKNTKTDMESVLTHWESFGAAGWYTEPSPWLAVEDRARAPMARLLGAHTDEVVLMNGLTVNIHLLFATFYRPSSQRTKIICERMPFPSDMSAMTSEIAHAGLDPQEHLVEVTAQGVTDPNALHNPTTEDFIAAIRAHKDDGLIVWVAAVHFCTGQFFDIGKIASEAHKHNMLVGVDAAHAVANVPLHFHEWAVDFGVWCNYKYISGGPGAIGGAFVHSMHFDKLEHGSDQTRPSLKGWWSRTDDTRFLPTRQPVYRRGAALLPCSSPNILAITAIQASLDLLDDVGMDIIRKKSMASVRLFETLLDRHISDKIEWLTPRDPDQRGSTVAIRIREGRGCPRAQETSRIIDTLAARKIMIDRTAHDVIRVSFNPLIISARDVYELFQALREALA